MEILKQNVARLSNYEEDIITRMKLYSNSGIYHAAAKKSQFRMVAYDRKQNKK